MGTNLFFFSKYVLLTRWRAVLGGAGMNFGRPIPIKSVIAALKVDGRRKGANLRKKGRLSSEVETAYHMKFTNPGFNTTCRTRGPRGQQSL
jgi:hypothetical protein